MPDIADDLIALQESIWQLRADDQVINRAGLLRRDVHVGPAGRNAGHAAGADDRRRRGGIRRTSPGQRSWLRPSLIAVKTKLSARETPNDRPPLGGPI